MSTIRELFHDIGNSHNKISVAAGITGAELRDKFKNTAVPPEIEKTIKRLADIERYATEAGSAQNQLNDIIYDILDPDTGKPKKG